MRGRSSPAPCCLQSPPFPSSGFNRGRRSIIRTLHDLLQPVVASPSLRSRRKPAGDRRLAASPVNSRRKPRWAPLFLFSPSDRDPAASIKSLKWNGVGWSGASMPLKIQRLS
jgi:hypothetical protein